MAGNEGGSAKPPVRERAVEVVEQVQNLSAFHAELWALVVLALKPKPLFSTSQHDPLAMSLGNLLVLLLKSDFRLSEEW